MRKVILGLIVLVGVASMSESANARDRQSRRRQPRQQSYQQYDRPSFFGGLIEMERRKNAWLRQTFFGR
ncbi:MAG TPA: hypothetical protein VK137_14085 [Planctomycetaceae bacterium]|nr:hypothetical protein [Planctomycetaceae bacterium]